MHKRVNNLYSNSEIPVVIFTSRHTATAAAATTSTTTTTTAAAAAAPAVTLTFLEGSLRKSGR
jgi:hypothetical protein